MSTPRRDAGPSFMDPMLDDGSPSRVLWHEAGPEEPLVFDAHKCFKMLLIEECTHSPGDPYSARCQGCDRVWELLELPDNPQPSKTIAGHAIDLLKLIVVILAFIGMTGLGMKLVLSILFGMFQ